MNYRSEIKNLLQHPNILILRLNSQISLHGSEFPTHIPSFHLLIDVELKYNIFFRLGTEKTTES